MSIEDDIDLFERVPTLALLGRQALRILAMGAEGKYVPEGMVLFHFGEEADSGYVIQRGSFSLDPHGTDGAVKALTVGPHTLLGEFALLTETLRPATATALEPSTVIRISRSLFLKMLDGFPDAARRLRDHVAARTGQAANDLRAVQAALDVASRPR